MCKLLPEGGEWFAFIHHCTVPGSYEVSIELCGEEETLRNCHEAHGEPFHSSVQSMRARTWFCWLTAVSVTPRTVPGIWKALKKYLLSE